MAHLLITTDTPLNARRRQSMGIDHLVARGNRVTYVDVANIVMPALDHERAHYSDYDDIEIMVARDRRDLSNFAKQLGHVDMVFCFLGGGNVTADNFAAHKFIAAMKAPYLITFTNAYPGWNRYRGEKTARWKRFRDIARRLKEIRPAHSFVARIPPRLLGVGAPRFMIVGGRSCAGYGTFVGGATEMIVAHAADYETFRKVADLELGKTETAVFIDEFLPFHPDKDMMGLGAPMEAEPYFACLRHLFDRVERELSIRVVIAACPRADYDRRQEDFFGDREVVFEKTAELVAQSKLVIAHRSTAINFAVLFRKPIMITATRESYHHTSQMPYFDGFVKALEQDIQFIDDAQNVDLTDPYSYDDAVYDRFIEDFIKVKQSPDLAFWDIVVESINRSGVATI